MRDNYCVKYLITGIQYNFNINIIHIVVCPVYKLANIKWPTRHHITKTDGHSPRYGSRAFSRNINRNSVNTIVIHSLIPKLLQREQF